MNAKDDTRGGMTRENFREAARRAIAAYYEKGLIIDSLFWSTVIAFYDQELEAPRPQ
jgi:hypothetical protein